MSTGRASWGGGPWGESRWGPRRRRHPRAPRLLLPAVVALIQVFGSSAAAHGQPGARTLDGLGYALLLAGPVALAVRHTNRLRPLVTVVAVAAACGYFTLGYPRGPGFVAALIALLGAARAGDRVTSWVAGATGYLTWAVAGRIWPGADPLLARPRLGEVVLVGAWLLVVYAVAEAKRRGDTHIAEALRARAERQRAAQEQERRQASEERLSIARELHDVVGHHLSLINVQAGVGLHLMEDRPEQARAALAAIKQASAEALREVRAVLAALQADSDSAPLTPAPGLAGLDALVAELTAAGQPVRVEVVGSARALPAEVDRAAYRIVREALTNVRRHAGPGACAVVSVEYRPGEVALRVVDDGVGVPPSDSTVDGTGVGSGIAGMRERTVALGGDFVAEPVGSGGFQVSARLPAAGMGEGS